MKAVTNHENCWRPSENGGHCLPYPPAWLVVAAGLVKSPLPLGGLSVAFDLVHLTADEWGVEQLSQLLWSPSEPAG